jgi:hypothetical protein
MPIRKKTRGEERAEAARRLIEEQARRTEVERQQRVRAQQRRREEQRRIQQAYIHRKSRFPRSPRHSELGILWSGGPVEHGEEVNQVINPSSSPPRRFPGGRINPTPMHLQPFEVWDPEKSPRGLYDFGKIKLTKKQVRLHIKFLKIYYINTLH